MCLQASINVVEPQRPVHNTNTFILPSPAIDTIGTPAGPCCQRLTKRSLRGKWSFIDSAENPEAYCFQGRISGWKKNPHSAYLDGAAF
jgi:hypothetical protein